jgi:hypothetical protein
VRGVRMNERDLEPEEAAMRLLVDKLDPLLGETLQLPAQVAHLESDVVHAGAALGEEPADVRVLAERPQQLDTALPDPDRRSFDALGWNRLTLLELAPEDPPIGVERLVEIVDGHAEMVNPLRLHW